MNPPSEDTLYQLKRLTNKASMSGARTHLAEELRRIELEYGEWLHGQWHPTDGEVQEHFVERFTTARQHARKAKADQLTQALQAMEDTLLGQ